MARNYRGELIPFSCGLTFVLTGMVFYTLLPVSGASPANASAAGSDLFSPLVAALAISMAGGLLDDIAGAGEDKGIGGHLKALVEGRVTAGAFKALSLAIAGGLLATPFFGREPERGVAALLLVPLTANTLNLLDLRPGRAGKAFFFLALIGLLGAKASGLGSNFALLTAPLAGSLAGYLPFDLKGRVMMGDAGANPLGVGLAAGLVTTAPLSWVILSVVLLVALHVLAERYSFTRVIEANPCLRFLDSLGRSS